MSSTIYFIKGTKSQLQGAADSMSNGSLAVATDEMQWYLKDNNELKSFDPTLPVIDNNQIIIGDKILTLNEGGSITWSPKTT